MRAVATAVRCAVLRRRLPSLVIGTVALLSSATAVLAIGLLVVSDAPFDTAFARQSGAHAAAAFDPALVSAEALVATASRPGVIAAAGPFETATVAFDGPGRPLTVVGRADQGGPVDRLALDSGRWLAGPGEIVLGRELPGPPGAGRLGIGDAITANLPGSPTLQVVGIATSITDTADAWVWPTQDDVIHPAQAETSRQMLYRFDGAGDHRAVRDGLTAATAGLPAGALTGSASYLTSKLAADSSSGPVVPFVVAFAVLGLVMAVLIVSNVVSGAVVAGYRIIGVLKSLGFSPGQVVVAFAGQATIPGLIGCLLGLPLGNALALPLLRRTERAYGVTAGTGVPLWVDVLVGIGLPVLIAAAAMVPAWRAGRFPAVQAISVGRAPRTGRGYRVRRWLASTRLPRPVGFGLATPFTRPTRTAVTLVAILLGAVTVVFAAGLSTTLTRTLEAFSRTEAVPVNVLPRPEGPGPSDPDSFDAAAVRAAVQSHPGTAHVVASWQAEVTVPALTEPVEFIGYDGEAGWTGHELISGRWFTGPGEVVAGSPMLRSTGLAVGDSIVLTGDQGEREEVRISGEVFDNDNDGLVLIGDAATLGTLAEQRGPVRLEVGLAAGTDLLAYVDSLNRELLGLGAFAARQSESNPTLAIMLGLIATLTMLLSVVAALGVVNTVVLNTRERVHEIGVLKAIGMTPGQVRTMVITSMTGVGMVAGVLALPLGYALHRAVVPIMAGAVDLGVPDILLTVYAPAQLAALAAAGMVLAVIGALLPAGWAARARAATALRSE